MDVVAAERTAQAYLFFARAFDYPRPEFWDTVEGKRLEEAEKGVIVPPRSQEEREIEYINTFVVGRSWTPPCPLYEGLYRKDEGREGLLMELLRFYHHFGLRLSEGDRDFPDHLTTELEFMGYLAAREAAALAEGRDAEPYRRAQRDFLERHLLAWVPRFAERVSSRSGETVMGGVAGLLADFIAGQRRRLAMVIDQTEGGERWMG